MIWNSAKSIMLEIESIVGTEREGVRERERMGIRNCITIMEADKSKTCRVSHWGRRPREIPCSNVKIIRQAKLILQRKSKGVSWIIISYSGKVSLFCFIQAFN